MVLGARTCIASQSIVAEVLIGAVVTIVIPAFVDVLTNRTTHFMSESKVKLFVSITNYKVECYK